MKQSLIFLALLVIISDFYFSGVSAAIQTDASCAKKNPPVPSGSKWMKNTNCANKPTTYNIPASGSEPAYHCHCWGYCGFICDPQVAGTADEKSCSKKKPNVPIGSEWVLSPNCPRGGGYKIDETDTDPAYRCHCWGFCGYVCDPL